MIKKSKYWKSGLKLWMLGKNKHFLFNKYCSTYTLKFFTADNTDSPLVFANIRSRFIELSLRNRCVISTLSLNYQWKSLQITFRRTDCSIYNKNQRRVCIIRGEEFQRVGRKIFIKSKKLLCPHTLIISTLIFKIYTFLPSYNHFNITSNFLSKTLKKIYILFY